MVGAVIENLSNRKLSYILGTLLIVQIAFFLVGAWIAPHPTSSMEFEFRSCIDKDINSSKWIDHSSCKEIELSQHTPISFDLREIVFMTQMPHRREGRQLEYRPSFQFLLGVLQPVIKSTPAFKHEFGSKLRLEVRMGYRSTSSPSADWKLFQNADVIRNLDCQLPPGHSEGEMHCESLDFFEFGYVPHSFYVLNVRIPIDREGCARNPKNTPNCQIGELTSLHMVVIHQNGGFTMVWLWMKTLITPFLLAAVHWYWNRVSSLPRRALLLEKAILVLGVSTTILDFPIEWASIWFERIPFMLLLADIRQGLFYAVLCSFWLIFAGEHLIDDPARNNLACYWRNLSLVVSASAALLLYDVCERGMQISDAFYSIWSTENGSRVAYLSIYLATICTIAYFIFLFYKIWMVWTSIKRKRAAQLYQTNESRRLKVEAVIFRFKFLMLFTLVCAGLTIASYAIKQHGEAQLHDEDGPYSSILNNATSAFFTGTFGMWNIYVLLLLFMYAPSHKQYGGAQMLDETEELMDGSEGSQAVSMSTLLRQAQD